MFLVGKGITTDISLLTLLYYLEENFSFIVVSHAESLFNTYEFSVQASLKHGVLLTQCQQTLWFIIL